MAKRGRVGRFLSTTCCAEHNFLSCVLALQYSFALLAHSLLIYNATGNLCREAISFFKTHFPSQLFRLLGSLNVCLASGNSDIVHRYLNDRPLALRRQQIIISLPFPSQPSLSLLLVPFLSTYQYSFTYFTFLYSPYLNKKEHTLCIYVCM